MRKRAPIRKSASYLLKKAKAKLEKLQREVVLKRDGDCVLRHLDPLEKGCSYVMQADHFVTKHEGNDLTRYDLRNLNQLCSGHNCVKQYRAMCTIKLARVIDERYGEGTHEELEKIAKKKDGVKLYMSDIEAKIKECEDYLANKAVPKN